MWKFWINLIKIFGQLLWYYVSLSGLFSCGLWSFMKIFWSLKVHIWEKFWWIDKKEKSKCEWSIREKNFVFEILGLLQKNFDQILKEFLQFLSFFLHKIVQSKSPISSQNKKCAYFLGKKNRKWGKKMTITKREIYKIFLEE